MSELARGLYETLITELLSERLERSGNRHDTELSPLRDAEAADRIALHLASVVERAVERMAEDQRSVLGIQIARRLIDQIVSDPRLAELSVERPLDPGSVLRSIRTRRPDGQPEHIPAPLIPLLDTALLTNSPGEPTVGSQIEAEIASADRIDIVMAFVRRSGIRPVLDRLRRRIEAGHKVRVLTTTYTGTTEPDALKQLVDIGADVRVSYDTGGTRLHAKSWLFHRDSGYSTAYVGSSNLTHSAQVTGLEWNVRISGARNRAVIEKIAAVFNSYWAQPEFEPYDPERFSTEIHAHRSRDGGVILSPVEIRLEPYQERLLELIELAREQGHHRNLLVSATGTGKTVMAAVDYARLKAKLARSRLLFVAHREELLAQSRATFAHALRDANFGEMWVGGARPTDFEHVFASIQSLSASGYESIDPQHFDVVVVDEFHHAAAASYERLLNAVQPLELLGLTATPERSDGLSILQWFDGRIAAELRLWDAIDQHRLVPFAYYGIADDLDLREVPWTRGRGYDVERVTRLMTSTDAWARGVLKQFVEHAGTPEKARALGFCVSVEHARYMSRVFEESGVRSVAIWADTPGVERNRALQDLAAGKVNVVFSVDLFNEGVDVPNVDMLLMLRPTDSGLLFLQQLGRGLRKAHGKALCTVLDFVGQHRKEFRYDRRFRALLGGSRKSLIEQVENNFPFLPAGCHMSLDRVASERVMSSIRNSLPTQWRQKVAELSSLAAKNSNITLAEFLDESGLELEDVYGNNLSWSEMREAAGLPVLAEGPHDRALRRACGRLLHVDDTERLDTWAAWLRADNPLDPAALGERQRRLLRMLFAQLFDQVSSSDVPLAASVELLWEHPQIRAELLELFDVLGQRVSHVSIPLEALTVVPLRAHGRYTRLEILSAALPGPNTTVGAWQSGVYWAEDIRADLFAFTLDKTRGQFSPTTRYRDYAISRDLIHWESQSTTREDSETGLRYRTHESMATNVLMFARLDTDERAFHFLGPATYVSHVGERPMAVTWRLHHAMPGDVFQSFAAAVA